MPPPIELTPYQEAVKLVNDDYWYALLDYDDSEWDITVAWAQWNQSNHMSTLQFILRALDHIASGNKNILGNTGGSYFHVVDVMELNWEYETENIPVVTWESIVEAWLKDDFEGRVWTIGALDRMRQILWDEPYDLKWAARPEDKPVE